MLISLLVKVEVKKTEMVRHLSSMHRSANESKVDLNFMLTFKPKVNLEQRKVKFYQPQEDSC